MKKWEKHNCFLHQLHVIKIPSVHCEQSLKQFLSMY
jgi:hypothetical protein